VPSYALGIDIGGTFTDIVVYDHDTGRQWLGRRVRRSRARSARSAPSTPVALQALLNR